ncbi:DUF6922 domain-containing protein [Echinicola rosea]|uniref:DUF6922 domain-containing protein n=1 Tax=Echinicola rosea TaxID=1807691 RepID=A0ABQ1V9B5_9BACT|nr:hypothetical protein [Echinicola rosea]GGF44510.1 hypothetical protein GCM10011339_36280 [Echinicola rosea]
MKKTVNIATQFPKHLFWDMDPSKLSVYRDKSIIIPRALFATTRDSFEQDIQKLEDLYSKRDILDTLKKTKEHISNEVCKLVSVRYKVAPFFRYSL